MGGQMDMLSSKYIQKVIFGSKIFLCVEGVKKTEKNWKIKNDDPVTHGSDRIESRDAIASENHDI